MASSGPGILLWILTSSFPFPSSPTGGSHWPSQQRAKGQRKSTVCPLRPASPAEGLKKGQEGRVGVRDAYDSHITNGL